MAPNVGLTAQPPPARMPKLKYRNLVLTDSKAFVSLPISQGTEPHSTFSQEPPTTPDTNAQSSTTSYPSFDNIDTASVTSFSLASITPSRSSSNDSKSSKKKKKTSSVLGFLSLKEPSQVALEQFAEQQRKQNAANGRASPQSRASTSSVGQQLPPNVPKVNSKWDGVPETLKQNRNSTSSGSSKDNRSSLSSRGSPGSPLTVAPWNDSRLSVLTDGTQNPPNSIASASIPNLTHQLSSSPSATNHPEICYYAPDAPVVSSPIHETEVQSPTRVSDSTSNHRPSMDEMADSRPHSPASSTTSTDTVVMNAADTIFRKLNDRPFQGENQSNNVPESHDFLFQPQPAVERRNSEPLMPFQSSLTPPPIPHYAPARTIQNFSRPMGPPPVQRFTHIPPYKRTPSVPTLPTLYEASMASTEDLREDSEDDNDDNNDSYSITPSTIAPSELSRHWYKSPRERLGLGRRLQINDVLPWDEPKETTGKPKKSRLSMFQRVVARG
ncbi:ca2+-modulated nonselective cation channel polycystin [Pyrenophora seminiperda CCB06]|uniref:Ca2+-modulated nonselective cation channel polycystin n=1 Tax=Pyrenophora seminiperda CCB06 TaxID=1302712 RepID=A0A3M7LXQ5_9PLEO|nr:ca2+-modulated nonselective cation channel polycystin [Pyrenophora seminiperda CCB06]